MTISKTTMPQFAALDVTQLSTPCFVVDEKAIERNLQILQDVAHRSGAKILAALKAFSMWHLAPLTRQYLSGTCASGLHEARLGREEYGGEVHVFSAAFSDDALKEIVPLADHIIFNSIHQWQKYKEQLAEKPSLEVGLRLNPEHSEGTFALYDPCAENSRLGITFEEFEKQGFFEQGLEGIDGLHFHTLCEQGFEPLDRTLAVIEKKFSVFLHKVKWINFGGGHHITQPGYKLESLITRIREFSEKYRLQVYLEPGEAIAINAGVLVSRVLDKRGKHNNQLILDTSATCHMPDTLEVPYRPEIHNAGGPLERRHDYFLGGMTCLAGDSFGEYSFDYQLEVGDPLIFMDMAHYTMVKTTTFNGITLPSIYIWNSESNKIKLVKSFDYEDFKNRLS